MELSVFWMVLSVPWRSGSKLLYEQSWFMVRSWVWELFDAVGLGAALLTNLLYLTNVTRTVRGPMVGVRAKGADLVCHMNSGNHLCRSCLNGQLGRRTSVGRLPRKARTCLARNVRSCFRPTLRVIRGSNGSSALLGCMSRSDQGLSSNMGRAIVALTSSRCPMAIGLRCITCTGRSVVGAFARVDRHRGGPMVLRGCTSSLLRLGRSGCFLARFTKS